MMGRFRQNNRLRKTCAWLVLAALWCVPPGVPVASASPQGEEIVNGQVTIHRDGSVTLITASDGSIINFDSFDIFAGEVVRFLQPHDAARVMNRVLGGDPTKIDGSLLANGQVYILNPAGIFFGGEAVVDVGRLVAAAGHMSDADFLANIDRFSHLTGPVENYGTVTAQDVSLLGRTVANHGIIATERGMITLAAGDDIYLASLDGRVVIRVDGPADGAEGWGVENTGVLDAGGGGVFLAAGDSYSLALNHTGITRGAIIELDGGAEGLVQVSGTLDASDRSADGVGGRVRVLGDRVRVDRATIDASGTKGGGEILVGGDARGEGDVRTAQRTHIGKDATLRADAEEEGDGGEIVVWADGATAFEGTISARGGERGGDGGFAEVSGKEQLLYRGLADLRAPEGERGQLLLDPTNIKIVSGDGADPNLDDFLTDDGVLGASEGGEGVETLSETTIEAQSQLSSILLEATNDITLEDLADHTLSIGSEVTDEGGFTSGIAIRADSDNDGAGVFEMKGEDDTIRTVGGGVDIRGAGIKISSIDTSGADASGDAGGSGQLAGNIIVETTGTEVLPEAGGDADGEIDLTGRVIVTGTLTARGGNAKAPAEGTADDDIFFNGGNGGLVSLLSSAGSMEIGSAGAGTVIDTTGGNGVDFGGNSGNIALETFGRPLGNAHTSPDGTENPATDRIPGSLTVTGDLVAKGGDAFLGDGGNGGRGGSATLRSRNDSLSVTGDIDVSGGDGAKGGGDAGRIQLMAGNVPLPGTEDFVEFGLEPGVIPPQFTPTVGNVVVDGDLIARGGNVVLAPDAVADPTRTYTGGFGGFVTADSFDGAVQVANIDTSGGDGPNRGGDAGDIRVKGRGAARVPDDDATADLDESRPRYDGKTTVTGTLTAKGGNATGRFRATQDAEGNDLELDTLNVRGGDGGIVLVEAIDGDAEMNSADVSGGSGEVGGDSGNLSARAHATEAVVTGEGENEVVVFDEIQTHLTVNGTITAQGGAASRAADVDSPEVRGGNGGNILLETTSGNVTAASVNSVGADATVTDVAPENADNEGNTAFGGDAGTIVVNAGTNEDGVGGVTLTGNLRTQAGTGTPAAESGSDG